MIKRLVIFAVVTFVLLPVFATLYFRADSYPSRSSKGEDILTNNYVLKDAVPPQVYSHTLNVLTRYRAQHHPKLASYTIEANDIPRDSRGYYFVVVPSDGSDGQSLVEIKLQNYGNLFGITVEIDGETQGI